ncbi:hypothetical protein OV320_7827 [Actinobacteria bacterium OV320]|nr:hypothetical protein OV320_7827 [Actinobacteria bacterium OV320]
MSRVKAATPEHTEMMIVGSGFSNYAHWGALSPVVSGPKGWEFIVENWDAYEECWKPWCITHEMVMRAVRLIAKGEVKGASARLVTHCRFVMFDVDEVDLDAFDIDVLLQVVIHGRIIY